MVAAVAMAGEDHFVEEATSVKFPLDIPGEKSSLVLLGATVRVKKILFVNVQVYAVGVYTEPGVVEELKGKEPNDMYKYLMEHPVQSSLRLTMVRSVTGDQMGGALKEAVQPRLKLFARDEASTAGDMSAFEKQFDMSSLAAGTVLTFSRLQNGNLRVSRQRFSCGTIEAASAPAGVVTRDWWEARDGRSKIPLELGTG
ncbi:hypothetical protein GUITHDRAFT_151184, partial [Guillardia theta CCMP2712]